MSAPMEQRPVIVEVTTQHVVWVDGDMTTPLDDRDEMIRRLLSALDSTAYLNPHTHDLETPPEEGVAAVVHRYVLWLNATGGCDAYQIARRTLRVAEHCGTLRGEWRAWLHGDTSTLDKVAAASAKVAFSAAVVMHTCDHDANLTSFLPPARADRSRIDQAEVRIAIHYGRAILALGASDRLPNEFVSEMGTVATAAVHLIASCGFSPAGMLLDYAREVARQMDEHPSGASR